MQFVPDDLRIRFEADRTTSDTPCSVKDQGEPEEQRLPRYLKQLTVFSGEGKPVWRCAVCKAFTQAIL